MKIGIITFHFASNQGGALQAWACQTFLERQGHEAVLIDYRPAYHTVRYAAWKNPFLYTRHYWQKFRSRSLPKRLLLTVRSFARCFYMNIRGTDAKTEAAFRSFTDKYVHQTKRYRSLRQLREDPPDLDAYVTGSDQLWNPDLTEYRFDPAYFLSFGEKPIPKVAYAVSTGRDLSPAETARLRELAAGLTAVSLREYSPTAAEAIGGDVHVCLDPTLLLEAADYAPLESGQTETEPYVFVYGFETNDSMRRAVELASEKTGCRVLNGSPNRVKLGDRAATLRDYGPDRFLTLIKNARYVVTDSFHATVFSILYQKEFVTVLHSTRGGRLTDLLGKLDLSRRLWGSGDFDPDTPVDWHAVNERLSTLRQHAGEYLLSALRGVPGREISHWPEERLTAAGPKHYVPLGAYAGSLTDEMALLSSASGGAASALAEAMLRRGGCVAGAAYTPDFTSAAYILAETPAELEGLKDSKYVSAEGKQEIFARVGEKLAGGAPVLFIGLPCDVGALKSFLEKRQIDDRGLLTADLLCHGPTLPAAQTSFVRELEAKYNSKITAFSARRVRRTWAHPWLIAKFENGKTFRKPLYETDLGFALKYFARPSCYACRFKGENHVSDLTLGDCWGLKPGRSGYDKNGVSLLLTHTPRGEAAVQGLDPARFRLFPVPFEPAEKQNPMFASSAKKPAFYERFASDLQERGLHYAVMHSPGRRVYRKAALKNRLLVLAGKK